MKETVRIIQLPKISDKRGNLSFLKITIKFRLRYKGRFGFMMFLEESLEMDMHIKQRMSLLLH